MGFGDASSSPALQREMRGVAATPAGVAHADNGLLESHAFNALDFVDFQLPLRALVMPSPKGVENQRVAAHDLFDQPLRFLWSRPLMPLFVDEF